MNESKISAAERIERKRALFCQPVYVDGVFHYGQAAEMIRTYQRRFADANVDTTSGGGDVGTSGSDT